MDFLKLCPGREEREVSQANLVREGGGGVYGSFVAGNPLKWRELGPCWSPMDGPFEVIQTCSTSLEFNILNM